MGVLIFRTIQLLCSEMFTFTTTVFPSHRKHQHKVGQTLLKAWSDEAEAVAKPKAWSLDKCEALHRYGSQSDAL